MNRKLFITFFCFISFVTAYKVNAQSSPQSPQGTSQGTSAPTLRAAQPNQRTLPQALRASVINSIVQYMNNSKQLELELTYDYLPENANFEQLVRRNYNDDSENPNYITFEIDNEQLSEDPKELVQAVPEEYREFLAKALFICQPSEENCSLNNFSLAGSNTNFEQYWRSETGQGFQALETSVNPYIYYQAILSQYMMTAFFACPGVNYTVDFEGDQPKNKVEASEKPSDKNITWTIEIVKEFFKDSQGNEVPLYLFSAQAKMPSLKLVFPQEAQKSTLSFGTNFKNCSALDGVHPTLLSNIKKFADDPLLLNNISPIIEDDDKRRDLLQKLQDERADSELEAILSFATGVGLTDIISKGIFGGTTNTSLITGAMVNEDDVLALAGANLELFNLGRANGGLLLGVTLDRDDEDDAGRDLYVGPSIQYSIFNISGGLRISEEGKDKIGTSFAGVASLDFSQLIGSKKKVEQRTLTNAVVGGGWENLLAIKPADIAVEKWTLKSTKLNPGQSPLEEGFSLVQGTRNEQGECKKTENGAVLQFYIDSSPDQESEKSEIFSIRPGCYFYDDLQVSSGRKIKVDGWAEIEKGQAFDIDPETGVVPRGWVISNN